MTIKELFKKVESINEANILFQKEEVEIYIDLGYGDSATYKTYNEFVKHFRKEWTKDYVEKTLESEITVNKDGYAQISGTDIIIIY